ncbi:cache domain-containing protein [Candidatus Omnitrophota bacterium]
MRLPLPRIFRKILPKRIWQQIFLLLIPFVIIPLIILGSLLIKTSQQETKSSISHNHKEIALQASGKIEEYIKGAMQSFKLTASILNSLQSNIWKQETVLVELTLKNPVFERVTSVDLEGNEIASSELGTLLKNVKDNPGFQKALTNEFYISAVTISKSDEPYFSLATPIIHLGRITGVLIAKINLRGVWDVVDNIALDKTGISFLIDNHGHIIAHPDKKIVLQNMSIHKNFEPEASNPILSTPFIEKMYNKNNWLTTQAPANELGWTLFITQEKNEAYYFLHVMKLQSWFLIGLSILSTLLLSLLCTHILNQPIKSFIKKTQEISNGDFRHSFSIRQRNDVGKILFAFNKMTRRLKKARDEERLSIVGKAATVIAHELKNSLVLIDTFIQLLPHRHQDPAFINEFSHTVPRELAAWKTMLKNMTDFSHSTPTEMTIININDSVNDALALTQFRCNNNKTYFKIELTDHLPTIVGNKEKINQVLINLITNALQATAKGNTITLSTNFKNKSIERKNPQIIFEIHNPGKMIPPLSLKRIFAPFYSTKQNGLGLGLAITKEIMLLHQGSITAKSNDQGTTFTLHFPVTINNNYPQIKEKDKLTYAY